MLFLILLLAHASEPARTVIESHDGNALGTFSDDSRWLLTVAEGGAILWDVQSGRQVRRFLGHRLQVSSAVISHDGRRVFTDSLDGEMRLWDVATGGLLRSAHHGEGQASLSAVHFMPDDKAIIGTSVSHIEVRDAETLAMVKNVSAYMPSDLQLFPNGKYALSQPMQGPYEVVDIEANQRLLEGRGTPPLVGADGTLYGSKDLFAPFAGSPFKTRVCTENPFAISADGRLMVVASATKLPRSIEFPAGQAAMQIAECDTGKPVGSAFVVNQPRLFIGGRYVVFSRDGQHLFVNGALYDVATGSLTHVLGGNAWRSHFVAFAPDGQRLLSLHDGEPSGGAISEDWALRSWDLSSLKPIQTVRGDEGLQQWPQAGLSADGKRLLLPFESFRVFETSSLSQLRKSALGRYAAVAARADVIATASINRRQMKVWTLDGTTLKEKKSKTVRVEDRMSSAGAVAISADGRFVAFSQNEKTATVWDTQTGATTDLAMPGGDGVYFQLALSPDGRVLAATDAGNTVVLGTVNNRKVVTVLSDGGDTFMYAPRLVFSADGRTLAFGAPDNTVRLIDVAGAKVIGRLEGHTATVEGIAFHPTLDLIATAGDRTIRLWRRSTAELVVTLVSPGMRDFAAVTPDGYYRMSRGASSVVHFARGLEMFPFESFDLLRHRPDVVLERLGTAPKSRIGVLHRAYEQRLKQMGFTAEQATGELHLPEVELVARPPLQTQQRKVELSVTAADSMHELDRLNVFVNDVPIFGAAGQSLRGVGQTLTARGVAVELSEGRNKIEVSVHNASGVESLRRVAEVTYGGPTREHVLHVVSVGVSNYPGDDHDLTYAAKDAGDLAKQLAAKHPGFAKVEVHSLLDDRALKGNVLGLRAALAKTLVDDQVVVFIAGHGLLDDKLDYYFATADIDFDNPASNGLAYEQLEGLLDAIPARRKLLLMDTCFSGEVDKANTVQSAVQSSADGQVKARATRGLKRVNVGLDDSFELVRELFSDLRRGSGSQVISSAGGGEFALESAKWNNGVFTFAVLDALTSRKADADQDGSVRVSELRDYVSQKVQALTNGQQKPTARRDNLGFDFNVD